MPSVFAKFKVRADKIDEARKALGQMVEHVRSNEPGNLAYIAHQQKDDPTVFLFYEKYASDEALAQHGANMKNSPVSFADLLDGAPEIVFAEEI